MCLNVVMGICLMLVTGMCVIMSLLIVLVVLCVPLLVMLVGGMSVKLFFVECIGVGDVALASAHNGE